MAYTFTLIKQVNNGNERMALYNVTADAGGSAAVATPIGFVDAVFISPISMNSATNPNIRINTKAASAAANGNVFVSSPTSGDNFFMAVYGRS